MKTAFVLLAGAISRVLLTGQDTSSAQRPTPEISGVWTPGFAHVFTSPTKLSNSQLFQGSGVHSGTGAHIIFGIGTDQPLATLHRGALIFNRRFHRCDPARIHGKPGERAAGWSD